MTAKIEAGEAWEYFDSTQKKLPIEYFKQPISISPFCKPNFLTLNLWKDIAVRVIAHEQHTNVEVYTYLDDGTPELQPKTLHGLIEKASKLACMEREGSGMGILSTYFLKEEGATLGFGEWNSILKIVHEKSPTPELPKMGQVISE